MARCTCRCSVTRTVDYRCDLARRNRAYLPFFRRDSEVKDLPGAKILTVGRGDVSIDHLTFAYQPYEGGAPRTVLYDINLRVAAGTTVALVGRSGAGKTTLAGLLPRFYGASAGRIEIDGVDISTVTLKSLRDSIGIVPQDAVLFSASIRENILYGRPSANDAEVWRALEQANIREFVESLPDKLDTVIGEGGVVLPPASASGLHSRACS